MGKDRGEMGEDGDMFFRFDVSEAIRRCRGDSIPEISYWYKKKPLYWNASPAIAECRAKHPENKLSAKSQDGRQDAVAPTVASASGGLIFCRAKHPENKLSAKSQDGRQDAVAPTVASASGGLILKSLSLLGLYSWSLLYIGVVRPVLAAPEMAGSSSESPQELRQQELPQQELRQQEAQQLRFLESAPRENNQIDESFQKVPRQGNRVDESVCVPAIRPQPSFQVGGSPAIEPARATPRQAGRNPQAAIAPAIPSRRSSDRLGRYRIGPGDAIFVEVQRFPNLGFSGAINPEGSIVLPLLGALTIEGLTLEQARELIQSRLNAFVRDPFVRIQLLQKRPIKITVTGEVTRPGFYIISGQADGFSEAFGNAGGASPTADLRNVRVRWRGDDGLIREQRIDLQNPLEAGAPRPDFALEDGDVVLVPRRGLTEESPIVGRSNLAGQQAVAISVLGEVVQPGFYNLPPSPRPIADALAIAGRATPTADLRRVRVCRLNSDGSLSRPVIVDLLNSLETGSSLPNFPLGNGDVVFVPRLELIQEENYNTALVRRSSLSAQLPVAISILGQVARPGFYNLEATLRPVADALRTAGGASPAADLRRVQVRRLGRDGTVSEEIIDLYTPLANNGQLPDLPLANGDVLFVPKLSLRDEQNYDSALVRRSSLSAQVPVAISILGQVAQPGFYNVEVSERPVADALRTAGGANPAADLRRVQVRRLGRNGTVSEEIVDLYTPLTNNGQLPYLPLANGDVLFVPKLSLRDEENYDSALVGRSSLASQLPVQISVIGEVAQPGFQELPPSPRPLASSLLVAGGTTAQADLRSVRVRRSLEDGTISEEIVDLFTPLQTGAELPNLRLGDGDVVFVPKIIPGTDEDYDRLLVARSRLAQQQISIRILSYPGQNVSPVPLQSGSTFADILPVIPIGQADLRDIVLIRFDPVQGKAVSRKIDAKELLKGDISQDVPLQDNDVIIIGRNLATKITHSLSTFTQPFRDILGFLLFFDQLRDSANVLFGP